MKKTFVAVVLCMALLSSFTVSASAYDVNDIYNQVTAIRNELGYPAGNWSSLRRAINYIADHLPSSPKDYSTVLSNIYSNTSSLASTVEAIKGDTNNISHRSTDILNKLADISTNIGTAQIAITNHIDSFASQNHSDFTNLLQTFATSRTSATTATGDSRYLLYSGDGRTFYYSWGIVVSNLMAALTNDNEGLMGYRTLYFCVKRLSEVLASDDDLQLKKDNKANEDAATDAFVNGSSSKTSLGTGDIGNLKDVGGTFNDLTSLNGQSSVSSFLNGLTSADGTGQGWFSEATRASLDAVSPVPTNKVRAYAVYRGERSSVYSILSDVSLVSPDMYSEPVDVASSASPDDPYNMSGFEDNYNWLWGDAS